MKRGRLDCSSAQNNLAISARLLPVRVTHWPAQNMTKILGDQFADADIENFARIKVAEDLRKGFT